MPLTVVSYNILSGGDDRLLAIAKIVRARQPDAVALLEANSRANVEALARDLGMELVYGEANCAFAVAWLSRRPIVRSTNHRLKVLAKTLLEIEVAWNGVAASLFATHLVHGRTAADEPRRTEEVGAILEVLGRLVDRPHLLVGDFNAVHPADPVGSPPPGEAMGYVARQPIQFILDAGYVDCYRTLHPDEPGYSYPSHHPWMRLDSIFASRSLAADLSACDVIAGAGTDRASDHLPVWAEFE